MVFKLKPSTPAFDGLLLAEKQLALQDLARRAMQGSKTPPQRVQGKGQIRGKNIPDCHSFRIPVSARSHLKGFDLASHLSLRNRDVRNGRESAQNIRIGLRGLSGMCVLPSQEDSYSQYSGRRDHRANLAAA
jgi:hypothetical protein